jgi:hypothetical protein
MQVTSLLDGLTFQAIGLREKSLITFADIAYIWTVGQCLT